MAGKLVMPAALSSASMGARGGYGDAAHSSSVAGCGCMRKLETSFAH